MNVVNPNEITNYNRTSNQLELFLLFAIVVANKKATIQSQKLATFLDSNIARLKLGVNARPFGVVSQLIERDELLIELQKIKMGQYNRLQKCFTSLINKNLDLKTVTCEELEAIPGIGFKTSRFFIVHSRKDCQYAILDTWILKYINNTLHFPAPKSTPTNYREYKRLEDVFLKHCQELQVSVAELDLKIWRDK